MDKPNNISPVDWAHYNQQGLSMNTIEAAIKRWPEVFIRVDEVELDEVEGPPPHAALTLAVHRAVSELEGQGEKSDRIAAQLLTALARFAAETGT